MPLSYVIVYERLNHFSYVYCANRFSCMMLMAFLLISYLFKFLFAYYVIHWIHRVILPYCAK